MSPDHLAARRLGDRLLLRVVDAAVAESARRAGAACACRPGCTDCCLGPFPINALDAWRLKEGMTALEAEDAPRAAAVRLRALAAVELLSPGFPGDLTTGVLGDDAEAEQAFCDRHASVACPALDPATGRCDIYEARPMSCRTYGPPVRYGEQELPPCRLWFVGAPPESVEHARVEPDPEEEERALLEAVNAEGEVAETLVAFALVR